jgi:hypothetical protein
VDYKLTTLAACRVANLDRQRFNEYAALREYPCAPATIPGRARLFDPNDMLGLVLFKRLMDDGMSPAPAGRIACAVVSAAKEYPEEQSIAFVETFVGTGYAYPVNQVPAAEDWGSKLFSGSTIAKVITFNVGHYRKIIAHQTEVERHIIGQDDPSE